MLTADARCVQQWLPAAAVDDVTGSSSDRRQASLEKAAAAIAAHVLAGKSGGAEAFAQLLSLSSRCAAGCICAQQEWNLQRSPASMCPD